VSAAIERVGRELIEADHAMRRAILVDPREGGGGSRTHRAHGAALNRLLAEAAAAGDAVALWWHEPERQWACGIEFASGTLVGRKPEWALVEDREREIKAAADRGAAADRCSTVLRGLGLESLDALRAILGKTAVRERWTLDRCMRAARARAEIARGANGASQWEIAIDGVATQDGTYVIMCQGVCGTAEAIARWSAQLAVLDQLAVAGSACEPASALDVVAS